MQKQIHRTHRVIGNYRLPQSFAVITGRMPRSGKLPVLNLLTGLKSGFSPRRGDSFAPIQVKLCRTDGHGGVGMRRGATPLTDFQNSLTLEDDLPLPFSPALPKSLPSPPFPTLPLPLHPHLSLRSRTLNPARGSGGALLAPLAGSGRSPSQNLIWCILALKSGPDLRSDLPSHF